MESPRKSKSLCTNIFLLLSTDLLTLFLSTTFYSSSCFYNPITTTTVATDDTTTNDFSMPSHDVSETTLDLPPEYNALTSRHLLPLGFNANFDSDTIYPLAGQACTFFPDKLRRFMSYKVNRSCPDDKSESERSGESESLRVQRGLEERLLG